jgi:hypothetical protein
VSVSEQGIGGGLADGMWVERQTREGSEAFGSRGGLGKDSKRDETKPTKNDSTRPIKVRS